MVRAVLTSWSTGFGFDLAWFSSPSGERLCIFTQLYSPSKAAKKKTTKNKCVSRTDTNPPFAFQTAFPRGTDFSVSTGRVKKLHTLLVSLYF